MKIKFNVEISQKDGFKENHLNFNGDADITIEELKELFNTYKEAEVDVEPEEPVTGSKYTVASNNEIYYVRRNADKKYYFLCPSILKPDKIVLKREVGENDFNNAVKYSTKAVYDTDILEFLEGKKLKEVVV
jgi:TPP-dependent trihydroxycyclohexane-1,2-dione (THcHDO) dehydratase